MGAFCCGSGHSCTTGPKGPDILLLGVSFSMSVRSLAHGTKASPCYSQFSHETLSQHLRAAEKTHKGSGSGARLRVTIRLCDGGWYVQRRGRRFINWISELVRVFLLRLKNMYSPCEWVKVWSGPSYETETLNRSILVTKYRPHGKTSQRPRACHGHIVDCFCLFSCLLWLSYSCYFITSRSCLSYSSYSLFGIGLEWMCMSMCLLARVHAGMRLCVCVEWWYKKRNAFFTMMGESQIPQRCSACRWFMTNTVVHTIVNCSMRFLALALYVSKKSRRDSCSDEQSVLKDSHEAHARKKARCPCPPVGMDQPSQIRGGMCVSLPEKQHVGALIEVYLMEEGGRGV